ALHVDGREDRGLHRHRRVHAPGGLTRPLSGTAQVERLHLSGPGSRACVRRLPAGMTSVYEGPLRTGRGGSMSTPSALLQVMIDAARKAARALVRDFGEVQELQVSKKGPGDFVTAADLRAEETLFEALTKARPGYGFIGEERGLIEGTDKTHTFIVDPIDGTSNFMHGMPHFAINIALEREGQIVAGGAHHPHPNQPFWAARRRRPL